MRNVSIAYYYLKYILFRILNKLGVGIMYLHLCSELVIAIKPLVYFIFLIFFIFFSSKKKMYAMKASKQAMHVQEMQISRRFTDM